MENNSNNNFQSKIIKPKKSNIKKEIYEMKPNIIISNSLRFVEPYEFKYQLYAKGRWIGKKLIDVLLNEFKQYTEEYFLNGILEGKLKINDKLVDKDYIMKRNDFLAHIVIRKENPIIDKKLDIVFENDDFLVVDKPSSWPVHVCGGYQFNSLHRILMDEYGKKDLKILHRLDKHTSGVVIMAKTKSAADLFRSQLHSDMVQKTYLCRVKGNFEHEKINVVRSIIFVNKAKGIYTDCEDNTELKEYYTTVYNEKFDKSGVKKNLNDSDNENDEKNDPKYAETNFEKIFYDEESNTSVLYAKPITGRTHQIRIHLRYLGYPIANDPCYGGIVYNDLKEFENPDMLKFQQYIPKEVDSETLLCENMDDNEKKIKVDKVLSGKLNYNKINYLFF